jgi:hypothetical protein
MVPDDALASVSNVGTNLVVVFDSLCRDLRINDFLFTRAISAIDFSAPCDVLPEPIGESHLAHKLCLDFLGDVWRIFDRRFINTKRLQSIDRFLQSVFAEPGTEVAAWQLCPPVLSHWLGDKDRFHDSRCNRRLGRQEQE